MDRGNIFERLLRSNLADILTPLGVMTRKWPRPPYAQRDFDKLWTSFEEFERYFLALGNIN